VGFDDRSLPGSAEILGEVTSQPKLGVGGHDEPGPALTLVGGADAGPCPAQGLLEEPKGVFQVEPGEKGSPETVHIRVLDGGAGVPQPQRV
jgi:hypothetical protein